MKFLNNYPIQKYAVKEYLQDDLVDLLFNYTLDHYDLPQMTSEEEASVRDMLHQKQPDMTKAIFKNEKVASRFVKFLEQNVAHNGRDTFAYTCRYATELALLYYSRSTSGSSSKYNVKHNEKMVRIFNPVLDELANDLALRIERDLQKVRQASTEKELGQLESLAKKHGFELLPKSRTNKM